MVSYAEVVSSQRRLALLRTLAEAPQHRLNAAILDRVLDELGVGAARAEIVACIEWLHNQGLLTAERVGPVVVATLTQKGVDVAAGEAHVEGVARPSPPF